MAFRRACFVYLPYMDSSAIIYCTLFSGWKLRFAIIFPFFVEIPRRVVEPTTLKRGVFIYKENKATLRCRNLTLLKDEIDVIFMYGSRALIV